MEGYSVTEEMVREAVERLLSAGSPEKIILFGSRVRGEATPDSDLDLLVIDSEAANLSDRYWQVVDDVLDVPADVIVRTPDEVESWRNVSNHFLTKVVREGRVLYERQIDILRESPPPNDRADHAGYWIRIGDRDLRRAEILFQGGGDPPGVCFFVQQAIEKYLKAVLAYEGADIPRVHNLKKLRRRLARAPRCLPIDSRVDKLSRYAANGRYREPVATEEFAAFALELARTVRTTVTHNPSTRGLAVTRRGWWPVGKPAVSYSP